jgi:hypothetical protein
MLGVALLAGAPAAALIVTFVAVALARRSSEPVKERKTRRKR